MNVLAVCSAAVITSLVALMLKRQGSEYSFILTVCAVTLIVVYVISNIALSLDNVKELLSKSEVNTDYFKVLLKCMGVCFITEFTCDCCKDASQNALAGAVILCGRVCVMITSLPLFISFLEITLKFSGGSV